MQTLIKIPLNAFKAVNKARSYEETRYYLGGVYVENDRLVATNGHILLKYELGNEVTGVGDSPFILQIDVNEKAMKPKDPENVYMHIDLERELVETYRYNNDGEHGPRLGVCALKVVDGTFPDYPRVIPNNASGEGVDTLSVNVEYVKIFGEAAKVFGRNQVVMFHTGGSESSPSLVYFSATTSLTGVIMPSRF